MVKSLYTNSGGIGVPMKETTATAGKESPGIPHHPLRESQLLGFRSVSESPEIVVVAG
jgi:hypothetical protein